MPCPCVLMHEMTEHCEHRRNADTCSEQDRGAILRRVNREATGGSAYFNCIVDIETMKVSRNDTLPLDADTIFVLGRRHRERVGPDQRSFAARRLDADRNMLTGSVV